MRSVLRSLHAPVYAREKVLVRLICPHLMPGYRVLDVGCGFGHLGKAIMTARPETTVEGLERVRRPGELIRITAYDGSRMPWRDDTFDAVILADVLHHEPSSERLLRESVRVSSRLVIIKDHLREGFLARHRISLLDWGANAGYKVPCTFRYNDLRQWRSMIGALRLHTHEEKTAIDIYPPVINSILGRGLHYFSVLEKKPLHCRPAGTGHAHSAMLPEYLQRPAENGFAPE